MIVNHINNANATTQTTLSVSGNLYNTNGTINTSAVTDFLNKLDFVTSGGTYTSPTIADRAEVSTNSFIFNMGYYVSPSGAMTTSKPITWQAVYARNGYLTIWMIKNYTTSDYNDKGYDVTPGSPFTDTTEYTKGPYDSHSNYSKSVLRDVTGNIYDLIAAKLDKFSTIVRSPSEANATWQATQTEDVNAYRRSSSGTIGGITGYYYVAHHNGLQSYSGKYTGWAQNLWDSTNPPYNDKFWIPSYVEIYNTKSYEHTTTGYVPSNDGGLWGLTATDRAFSTVRLDTNTTTTDSSDSGAGDSQYCWLRSGNSGGSNGAMLVDSSGSAFNGAVYNSRGVRPAAHLSLESLANTVGYNISASLASGATDRAQINGSNSAWSGKYTNGQGDLNITYTSNSNYYINSITLNGTSVTINESAPASYSTLGSSVCQYKVWRNNANTVTVTLNNCTAAINVVGNVGNTLNLSNTGGANVTSLNYSRATYDTTTATITGAVASGYIPQLRYGASEYVTLYNTSGNGTLGGINYSYSKLGTTDFTITITGISTGITNIPTVYINAINQVQITFNTTGGDGTVSLSTGNYTIGSTITVYAAPALNNAFVGWTDSTNPGNIITTNPLVVQVSTARTYTAIFSNSLLDGVAVGATVGGEVRMVGFDENTITDNDEVTLIAVCYTGYTFSGWYVNGELLSGYGASARVKYSEIKDKMVVAMFAPINNNSTNGETDNNQTSDIV